MPSPELAPLLWRFGLFIVVWTCVVFLLRSAEPVRSDLLLPVKGVTLSELYDSYDEARSGGRTHHAIDIHAPKGTPAVACATGVVDRLIRGARGGLGLYLRDETRRLCYYYGHLSAYARAIEEEEAVERGETLAYVGSTGNAETPHLHFAVTTLERDRCGGGKPVNPLALLSPDSGRARPPKDGVRARRDEV